MEVASILLSQQNCPHTVLSSDPVTVLTAVSPRTLAKACRLHEQVTREGATLQGRPNSRQSSGKRGQDT